MSDIINMLKNVNWETITIFGISITTLIPIFIVLVKTFANKLFNKISPDAKNTLNKLENLKDELLSLKSELTYAFKNELSTIKTDFKELLLREMNIEEELQLIISNNKLLKEKQNKNKKTKQETINTEIVIEEQAITSNEVIKEEVKENNKEEVENKETETKKNTSNKKNNVSYM